MTPGVPLRILIADDNEHDSILMSRALKRDGVEHEFKRVETPEELDRALRFEKWDAVLSDHAMPRMDSFHVLRRAEELAPGAPVIVVSGFIGEEAAAHVVREGARDFVSKERLGFLAPTLQRALADQARRQELEQARATLVKNERLAALGTFARGAAHEINNPLTYIQMSAELSAETVRQAMETPGLAPELEERLRSIGEAQAAIRKGAGRIAHIVRGLGTLANTGRPVGKPADVDELVLLAIPPPPEGVQLTKELRASCSAEWPRSAVEHIVSTLVENAYDAVQAKPDAKVSVATSSDGTRASIEVQDNGIGIPPAAQSMLFIPFHTTKPNGIGLNLAIAHRLVNDLHGTIDLDSSPGVGTRWRVRIPLSPGALADAADAIALRLP